MGRQRFPEEMGHRRLTSVLGVGYLPLRYCSGRSQRFPKRTTQAIATSPGFPIRTGWEDPIAEDTICFSCGT